MNIDEAVTRLRAIAPEALAGSWDNVGLLLQGDRTIQSALVTIDLTPAVFEEALEHDVDLVVSYHPTLFRPIKKLTQKSAHGPVLLGMARRGMHLYSPHTALDAVAGGINDWLLEAFQQVHQVRPIEVDANDEQAGAGRVAAFHAASGHEAIAQIKAHLGLDHVRVAGPLDRPLSTVAVCPGAGTTVFRQLRHVDLLLTGEMSHHDVLSWVSKGTLVVLTEHTNTERGYLTRYAASIRDNLNIQVHVSTRDHDPLMVR